MNPSPPGHDRTSFWKTVPGVLTAAGSFITAIAALIGALAAAGVFHPSGASPPSSSASTVSSSPGPSSTQSQSPSTPPQSPVVVSLTPASARASIDLVYNGDAQGCTLGLDILLDSQSVQPTGNRYTVHNVRTGPQPYSVAGTISCPTAGFCTADGSGTIDVVQAHSYAVTWLNTAAGTCTVTLNG